MMFPQWTSSLGYSAGSFGALPSPASPGCVSGALAACSGSPTAAQSREGSYGLHGYEPGCAQLAKQAYHTQQQQQQQQQQGQAQWSLRAAAAHGAARSPVRSSPFMRPCNVPPGLD
jgi:uncharacterized membrane protein YebE (DUF533 family)